MIFYALGILAVCGIIKTTHLLYKDYKLYTNMKELSGRNTRCRKCGSTETSIETLDSTIEVTCMKCGYRWEFITFSSPLLVRARCIDKVLQLLLYVLMLVLIIFL